MTPSDDFIRLEEIAVARARIRGKLVKTLSQFAGKAVLVAVGVATVVVLGEYLLKPDTPLRLHLFVGAIFFVGFGVLQVVIFAAWLARLFAFHNKRLVTLENQILRGELVSRPSLSDGIGL